MKVIELLAYSQFLRHSYLDTFGKLPWEEFVKDRQASFGSLRNIFLHCIFVFDLWINHLIRGDDHVPRINFEDFDSMDKVREYMERVESDVSHYLSTVTPEELSRVFDRKQKSGSVIQMTVEDMLIDFFQEETHHRGEFIAILWQMGIKPPHMGWGKYMNR